MPTLRPLPNPHALFRSRILFTTLPASAVPRTKTASYELTIKGTATCIPLLESGYHHPADSNVPLAMFTIDGVLEYAAFAKDHGPLNVCQVWYLAGLLAAIFEDPSNEGRAICMYSSPDDRLKSSAACLLATYFILIEEQTPWETLLPLSLHSFLPFRDAAQGVADHGISIQDIVWGVWKAKNYGLLSGEGFDAEAYEWWERPENGDLNMIGPFIAFASPVDKQYPKKRTTTDRPLRDVIDYFKEEGVQLVVRLNEKLYDGAVFEEQGMKHVEMHFPDGSNPPEKYVREFISLADQTISRGGKVAVHCKAGLGRTGVLIGAYLIYKYGFAPQEVIGFMRLIRPGMVVGPQQAFMNMMFATWIRWSAVDELNCLRRTTVFGAESTTVNTTRHLRTDESAPAVEEYKENCKAVLAIKEEVVCLEGVDSRVPATPSRVREGRDASMSVTRTPGQPRKTPSGKTVVPPDEDMESTAGIAPLTLRHVQPDPGSPAKPRTRLETLFDPPTTINPQRLFTSSAQKTPGLTRKAEDESPVRETKRRAVVTPGRMVTRRKSAAALEDVVPVGMKTPARSISRIPMMMGSAKSGRKVARSKSGIVGTPRAVTEDVFGSPLG